MGGAPSAEMATQTFVLTPTARQTATVIFLHGLGDTGSSWSAAFQTIKQDYIKYVFPTANSNPVTLNGGYRMPSWFDIYGLSASAHEDEKGIKESAKLVESLVAEEEKHGIAPNRIIVGGFSQGGAVTLYSGLTSGQNLAGIISLSTWLPLSKQIEKDIKCDRSVPILQCHGTSDPIVPLTWGQKTGDFLRAFKFNKHDLKIYPSMGHSSCDKEMEDVQEYIKKVLPPI